MTLERAATAQHFVTKGMNDLHHLTLDEPLARLVVEAFDVTRFTHIQRRVDETLIEGQVRVAVQLPRHLSVL